MASFRKYSRPKFLILFIECKTKILTRLLPGWDDRRTCGITNLILANHKNIHVTLLCVNVLAYKTRLFVSLQLSRTVILVFLYLCMCLFLLAQSQMTATEMRSLIWSTFVNTAWSQKEWSFANLTQHWLQFIEFVLPHIVLAFTNC